MKRKFQNVLHYLQYNGWDIYTTPAAPETITYCVTKERFQFNEPDQPVDALIRNLHSIALAKETTRKQQEDFVEAVNWLEYQDILAYKRVQQLSKLQRITRKYNGKKITIRDITKVANGIIHSYGRRMPVADPFISW